MEYIKSRKYQTDEFMSKIMGPNPVKLTEELLSDCKIPKGSVVCDLGSGQGLTSVFIAAEYGFKVYAADLWSDPCENRQFFEAQGLSESEIVPVKADAMKLPFEKDFFDAVICVDSYNYFARDRDYLDSRLLPFVRQGGYVCIAVPGMKSNCHDSLPQELLLSWSSEQLEYMQDKNYWAEVVSASELAEIIEVSEMESNEEVWADWIMQENEYAVNDRAAMNAGGGRYLNFIKIVLRKK